MLNRESKLAIHLDYLLSIWLAKLGWRWKSSFLSLGSVGTSQMLTERPRLPELHTTSVTWTISSKSLQGESLPRLRFLNIWNLVISAVLVYEQAGLRSLQWLHQTHSCSIATNQLIAHIMEIHDRYWYKVTLNCMDCARTSRQNLSQIVWPWPWSLEEKGTRTELVWNDPTRRTSWKC